MATLGKFNDMTIHSRVEQGVLLTDLDDDRFLLPAKECEPEWKEGDTISAFLYDGFLGKKKATLKKPLIALNEFALLEVSSIEENGVFMNCGLEKDLLVPPKQEGTRMNEGESHIIFMYEDRTTGKLYGSNKLEKRLNNDELTVAEGDEVELIIQRETDLGFSVIVNHLHRGLIFENEIFQDLEIGQKLKGYVKKIQEENRLDITIRPMGYLNAITPDSEVILKALKENDGFLPVTDKSAPDLIMIEFNMSKKAFKRALGALYKSKTIEIRDSGIHLN